MNATEEIIVIGENFIERRIILFPQQVDIDKHAGARLRPGLQARLAVWIAHGIVSCRSGGNLRLAGDPVAPATGVD